MKKYFLLLVGMLLCVAHLSAGLTSGYYILKNTGYSRYMAEDFSANTLTTSSSCADTDYEKMWKVTVSGSTITLQNVYTGHYVQAMSSNSQPFPTGSSSSNITITASGDGYLLKSGNYMHCASSQSYQVVGWWDSSSQYSIWSFESVTLSDADVTAAQNAYKEVETIKTNASTYNTALKKFFTDLSCSELNSTYSSYTETNLKSAMAAEGLPSSLQNVGASVLNQWSGETDPAIVKQFRVQTYKPYTRAYYARQQLNATQFNDMSNPTGIFANAKKDLLVFVGGVIPSGCTLRIAGGTGNNILSYTDGTELKQGVNAIKASADLTQFWIMYTYTSDTKVDMSTLSSLKIHIEGGTVLGYVNAADKTESAINAEYKKILDHANTVTTAASVDDGDVNFVVKGNRGVFFFPLDTYNAIWAGTNYDKYSYNTYEIGKSIDFFDSVLKWEWSVMGHMKRVVDGECDPTKVTTHENLTGGQSLYPTYYNNLALTLQGVGGSNPFSTTGYTSMPGVGGVESSYNAERVNFDNWCVGHESGHNNQGLINLPSSTESSNNLFSNVIQYQWGYRMSRGATIAETNNDFVSGTQFALRDIGETHRMYWQLYLYFHVAKNNTAFYPTFFNLLRSDGLDLSKGTCFTKFYEKACEAAGQDLTSFFTIWGFLQPFENTTFGDYTSRTLTLTQTEIDAAKARVAEKVANGTYKSDNLDIMFIEDRTETATRWDPFSTTAQKVSSDGNAVTADDLASTYGTMGSVASMTSGNTSSATGDFVYSITDGELTLNGTSAGAGVIVYDAAGNIIAYGNSTSITIPSSITDYSQITVKAVATNGTVTTAKSVIEAGTDDQKLTTLKELVEVANKYVNLEDDTKTKVGFYKASYLTGIKSLVAQANTVIKNKETSCYVTLINSLTEEIANIKANEDLAIKIVAGNTYSIRNSAYPARYASVSSKALVTNTNTTLTDAEKWQFVPTGSGAYYIYNVGSKTYVSYSATSTQAQANATSTDGTATEKTTNVAYTYNIVANGDGTFYLQANEAAGYKCWHSASNDSYKVVGWTAGADASKWYIQLVGETEANAASATLSETVANTNTLLITVASNFVESGQSGVTYDINEGYDFVTSANITNAYAEMKTAETLLNNSAATASQMTSENTTLTAKYTALMTEVLSELVAKSKVIFEDAVDATQPSGSLSCNSNVKLTSSMLSTNHQETSEGPIANMIDGDRSTYFHSTWSAATTDKHYWQVDLGDGNLIGSFNFSITSRNIATNNFPCDITVSGSNDGTAFTEIGNVTHSLATSGLVTFDSDNLGSADAKYRYLRFTVNKTGSGNGNNTNATYYFFSLSEFSLTSVTTIKGALYGYYSHLSPALVENVYAAMTAAEGLTATDTPALYQTVYHSLLSSYHSLLPAMGDVNGDGHINAADLSALVHLLNLQTAKTTYDFDGNGVVGASDVQKLGRIILKKTAE